MTLLNRRLIGSGRPDQVLVADHLAAAYSANLRRINANGIGYALPDSHCDHGNPADDLHRRQTVR